VTEDDASERRTAPARRRYRREIVHLRLNAAGWLRAHALVLAAISLVCVRVRWTVALLARSYFRRGYAAQVIGALALGEHADRWTGTLDSVIADPMTFDSRGQLRPVAVEGPSATARHAVPDRRHRRLAPPGSGGSGHPRRAGARIATCP
jgi:hypothetical protein